MRTRKNSSADWILSREPRPLDSSGKYEMPIIARQEIEIPKQIIGLNEALYSSNPDTGAAVHGFISDSVLDRLWFDFERNRQKLSRFATVFAPDYSVKLDALLPEKLNGVYRSRVIAQLYQRHGIKVIPTAQWATPDTFEFCFKGLPTNGIVAVSTIGVSQQPFARHIFQAGLREMKAQLDPKHVILYGTFPRWCDFLGMDLICFENTHLKWTRNPQMHFDIEEVA